MTNVYFDSSAFVKLLVDEDGSNIAAMLWNRCDVAISSRLAHPEVMAALAAAGRSGRLGDTDRYAAESTWAHFWASTRRVELTEDVTANAGHLTGKHSLGGADAVHLASALAVDPHLIFAVWDRRLSAGAEAAGLQVVPAAHT